MGTLNRFISDNHIVMGCYCVDSNPNMADSNNMDHWKVTLKRPGHKLTTYFSMGYGHNGKEPSAADVLDCLASDAAGVENANGFESWADEYGYETDSRKAEKTFKTCEKQAAKLQAFLGSDLYQSLLFHTERE